MDTGVYVITCISTGKFYIGSSSNSVDLRLRTHKNLLRRGKHHSPYMQHSWDKYGEKNFTFSLLDPRPPDQCVKREQYWLDKTKSYNPKFGFNTCRYAGSTTGRVVTEETKKKIRLKLVGRPLSDECKAKIGAAHLGKKRSDETKEKMRVAKLGWKQSEESKAKTSSTKLAKSGMTQELADKIRARYIPYHTLHGILGMAKELGFTRAVIQKIVNGTTWNPSRYKLG